MSEPTMVGQTDLLEYVRTADRAKLDLAEQIKQVDPRKAGAVGYATRLSAQLSLPYRNPGDVPVWTRRNGNLSLTVTPANIYNDAGLVEKRLYPYGAYPRLLMVWMASKVHATEQRTLSLGSSMAELMRDLEIPRGGKTRTELREQIKRLTGATIEVHRRTKNDHIHGERLDTFKVASSLELWWSARDPDDDQLLSSTITLSEEFYNSILSNPLPVDMRALAYLRRQGTSGLPIDIYVWLAYRMHSLNRTGKDQHVSWKALQQQFGNQYRRERDFRPRFLGALPKVLAAYPWAREGVKVTDNGLLLSPTRTPVLAKGRI